MPHVRINVRLWVDSTDTSSWWQRNKCPWSYSYPVWLPEWRQDRKWNESAKTPFWELYNFSGFLSQFFFFLPPNPGKRQRSKFRRYFWAGRHVVGLGLRCTINKFQARINIGNVWRIMRQWARKSLLGRKTNHHLLLNVNVGLSVSFKEILLAPFPSAQAIGRRTFYSKMNSRYVKPDWPMRCSRRGKK